MRTCFVSVCPERFFAVMVATVVPGLSFSTSSTYKYLPSLSHLTPAGRPFTVSEGSVSLSTWYS